MPSARSAISKSSPPSTESVSASGPDSSRKLGEFVMAGSLTSFEDSPDADVDSDGACTEALDSGVVVMPAFLQRRQHNMFIK